MDSDPPRFSLLFVDDDPQILSLLKGIFAKEGYHIHTAPNGPDALSLLAKTNIDAALIDLRMPEMDGLTLLEKIRDILKLW